MAAVQNLSFSQAAYVNYLRSVNRPAEQGRVLTPQIILSQAMLHHEMTLPPGSLVFIRPDIDGKDNAVDAKKLQSQVEMLQYADQQGWNVALIGHRRRPEPENQAAFFAGKSEAEIGLAFLHHNASFSDVEFLKRATGFEIDYIPHWLTERHEITPGFSNWVGAAKKTQGKIVTLGNDRLWPDFYTGINVAAKRGPTALERIAREVYYPLGLALQSLGFTGYIFEASSAAKQACFSKAGIAPFMQQVALGPATARELSAINDLLNADVYCLGGSKLSEKFPALISMIKANRIPLIITSGVIGFAMRYCQLVYEGKIEDDRTQMGAVYTNPPKEEIRVTDEHIDQGLAAYKTLESQGRLNPLGTLSGVLNPIDFRSANDPSRIVSFEKNPLLPDEEQWDIGPASITRIDALFGMLPDGKTTVASGTPGKEHFGKGFTAFQRNLKTASESGRVIGTGSEGHLLCPDGERIIAGGAAGMFVAGTTPAAFRIFDEHPSQAN